MKLIVSKRITYKQIKKLMNSGVVKKVEFASSEANDDQTIISYVTNDIKLNLYLPTDNNDGCLYFLENDADIHSADMVEIYFNFSGDDFVITEVINFRRCSSFHYGDIKINLKD